MDIDIQTSLCRLRKECQNTIPASLLSKKCPPNIIWLFSQVAQTYLRDGRLRLGDPWLVKNILQELKKHDVERPLIDSYCNQEFADYTVYLSVVIELLAYAFELDIGVFWSPGEVSRRCPELEFDPDGLLIGPLDQIRYHRDGVQSDRYLIPYCQDVHSYNLGLSGGLIENLLELRSHMELEYFGLRIGDHMLYDTSRYLPFVTKAYIRGPKGLSMEQLCSPDFPEDPRGTVTVHQRVSADPVLELNLPLLRTEFMWSYRRGIKTVQIEELVPTTIFHKDRERISNRYLHAIWDTHRRCFSHTDGAIRTYGKDVYDARLYIDIKGSREIKMDYLKLFRVDAHLPPKVWSDLVVRYFYQNELVLEYLDGSASGAR